MVKIMSITRNELNEYVNLVIKKLCINLSVKLIKYSF